MRLSVEVGLLAVAMTPILVTGGIDLSVGAMMGLAAVIFGAAYRDWSLPIGMAAAAALLAGCGGGVLNAALISALDIPPLIVTLGSLSLFRGLAEGITHGATNYSGFPPTVLRIGQGYLWGIVPAQLPILLAIVLAYAIVLHRSVIGRAWYAIGFAASGARYAGIPVARRVGLAYVLSGLVSSLAAIVYVAHLGQARADAGTGYELDAITAVVLGGTSLFGGRGPVLGSLIGALIVGVFRNGLTLMGVSFPSFFLPCGSGPETSSASGGGRRGRLEIGPTTMRTDLEVCPTTRRMGVHDRCLEDGRRGAAVGHAGGRGEGPATEGRRRQRV